MTREPPSQIATSPDGSREVIGLGALCRVIVEATKTGLVTLDAAVSDGGTSFRLDDLSTGAIVRPAAGDVSAWSPDGARISFFAAPAAIGIAGPSREEVTANLYSINPDGTDPVVIRPGIRLPRAWIIRRWQASGVGGEIDGRSAIWVLDLAWAM